LVDVGVPLVRSCWIDRRACRGTCAARPCFGTPTKPPQLGDQQPQRLGPEGAGERCRVVAEALQTAEELDPGHDPSGHRRLGPGPGHADRGAQQARPSARQRATSDSRWIVDADFIVVVHVWFSMLAEGHKNGTPLALAIAHHHTTPLTPALMTRLSCATSPIWIARSGSRLPFV